VPKLAAFHFARSFKLHIARQSGTFTMSGFDATAIGEGDTGGLNYSGGAVEPLPIIERLAGKIGSDYDSLNALHANYKFVPDQDGVRPSPEAKLEKAAKLEELLRTWKEFVDFIYHTVFGLPFIKLADGKLTVPNRHRDRLDKKTSVFQQQLFPYLIKEGHHFVMWYAAREQTKGDDQISAEIDAELQKITYSQDAFQFGCYINPKMTVPEFFHVQVFWLEKEK
jgi:hypothetical protein